MISYCWASEPTTDKKLKAAALLRSSRLNCFLFASPYRDGKKKEKNKRIETKQLKKKREKRRKEPNNKRKRKEHQKENKEKKKNLFIFLNFL